MPKAPRARFSDQITEPQKNFIKRLCKEKGKQLPPSFNITKEEASQLIKILLKNKAWPHGKSDIPAKPRQATSKQMNWLQSLCNKLGYNVPQKMKYSTVEWNKDMSMLQRHLNCCSRAIKKVGMTKDNLIKFAARNFPDLMKEDKKWTKAQLMDVVDEGLALEWKWGAGSSTKFSPLVNKPNIRPSDMLEFMLHYGSEPVRVSPKAFQACMMAYKMFNKFGWDEMNIRAAEEEGQEAAALICEHWNSLSLPELRREFFKMEGNTNKAISLGLSRRSTSQLSEKAIKTKHWGSSDFGQAGLPYGVHLPSQCRYKTADDVAKYIAKDFVKDRIRRHCEVCSNYVKEENHHEAYIEDQVARYYRMVLISQKAHRSSYYY